MQACLNSSVAGRNNLWQTANLIATGVYTTAPLCKADFTSNKKIICPGNTVAFTNASYNGTFTSIEWTFPGGSPATSSVANPTVTYSGTGFYNVSLKVKNGTDSVSIVRPNYIAVQTSTGTGLPYAEDFETVGTLNGTEWLTNNLDTSNTWELTNSASFSGTKSIMINNYNSAIDGKDELYSRTINLSGATGLSINFKYAFARKDTSNKDQLQWYGMSTCGGVAIQRFSAVGSLLETLPVQTTPFYPTQASEWKLATATLQSFFMTAGFRMKFVFSRHGGNNIFIDDINIDISTNTKDISETISKMELFPNPTTDNCTLRFDLSQTKTLEVNVFNILGEKVYSIQKGIYSDGENEIRLNTSHLNNGMYIVKVYDGVRSVNKQLIINK